MPVQHHPAAYPHSPVPGLSPETVLTIEGVERWSERVEYTAACPACGADATWVSGVQHVRDESGFVWNNQDLPEVLCCH